MDVYNHVVPARLGRQLTLQSGNNIGIQPRRGDIFIAQTAERNRGLACNFASGIVSPDHIPADAKFMKNRCG
jgi:hypothetical protein